MKTKEEIVTFMKDERERYIRQSNESCDKYCQTSDGDYLKDMNRSSRLVTYLRLFIMEVESSPNVIETLRDEKDYYQDKVMSYCRYLELTPPSQVENKIYKDLYEEVIRLEKVVSILKEFVRYAKSE